MPEIVLEFIFGAVCGKAFVWPFVWPFVALWGQPVSKVVPRSLIGVSSRWSAKKLERSRSVPLVAAQRAPPHARSADAGGAEHQQLVECPGPGLGGPGPEGRIDPITWSRPASSGSALRRTAGTSLGILVVAVLFEEYWGNCLQRWQCGVVRGSSGSRCLLSLSRGEAEVISKLAQGKSQHVPFRLVGAGVPCAAWLRVQTLFGAAPL